jgi:hypothetical protein
MTCKRPTTDRLARRDSHLMQAATGRRAALAAAEILASPSIFSPENRSRHEATTAGPAGKRLPLKSPWGGRRCSGLGQFFISRLSVGCSQLKALEEKTSSETREIFCIYFYRSRAGKLFFVCVYQSPTATTGKHYIVGKGLLQSWKDDDSSSQSTCPLAETSEAHH